jgi:hypothetical protein
MSVRTDMERRSFLRGMVLSSSVVFGGKLFAGLPKKLFFDEAKRKRLFFELSQTLTGLTALDRKHSDRILYAHEKILSEKIMKDCLTAYSHHIHTRKASFSSFHDDFRMQAMCRSILSYWFGKADETLVPTQNDRVYLFRESALWDSIGTPPRGIPMGFSSWTECVGEA